MSASVAESAGRFPAATPPGLLQQVWRRKGTWLLAFTAIAGAAAGLVEALPTRYTAAGEIIVTEPDGMGSNASSAAWMQKIGDPEDIESNLLLIRSPQLMRQVAAGAADQVRADCAASQRSPIARLGVRAGLPARDCEAVARDETSRLDWLQAHYGAGSVGRSRVLAVTYESPLPEVAQRMANALITAFLDSEKAKRLESRLSALAWVRQEMAQVGDALRREETEIEAYRQAHGLVRGQVAPISSERLSATSNELAQAEAAHADALARLRELGQGAGAARQVLEARTIEDLKQQLSQVTAQLASLSVNLGPSHPALAALRQQHDALQSRIAAETARIAESTQRAAKAAGARVASLATQLNAVQQQAGAAAASETQIASMVRDLEIKRTQYVDLSQRASQLETERRMLTTSVQLVHLAETPTLPSFPRKLPFLVGGFTLAGIAATGIALLRDKASNRGLSSPGTLQALTGLTILARIPADRWGRNPLLAADRDAPLSLILERLQTPSLLQESIRGLYARLTLMGYGTRLRTLLFTSSDSREGKTFTALALAQFAASSGRRVLLVECDMRRPSMQAALGLPSALGLAEYLSGKLDEVPVSYAARHPGLDVVLAGEASLASTELLTSPRFGELMKLGKHYDLVILDSPPSGLLMDACVIAPKVDGVLYCARWGRTAPEQVATGLQDLHSARGTIAGLVVTFAPQAGRTPYGTRVYGADNLMLEGA